MRTGGRGAGARASRACRRARRGPASARARRRSARGRAMRPGPEAERDGRPRLTPSRARNGRGRWRPRPRPSALAPSLPPPATGTRPSATARDASCEEVAERHDGLGHLTPFRFDDIEQLFWRSRVLIALGVRVDRLEVIAACLDLLPLDGPRAVAVGSGRQNPEELLEVGESERALLPHLHTGEVVIEDALSGAALGEEEQIRLDARASVDKGARGQAHDAPEVALVEELALGLDESRFVRAEEYTFVENDAAATAELEAVDHVLEEQY